MKIPDVYQNVLNIVLLFREHAEVHPPEAREDMDRLEGKIAAAEGMEAYEVQGLYAGITREAETSIQFCDCADAIYRALEIDQSANVMRICTSVDNSLDGLIRQFEPGSDIRELLDCIKSHITSQLLADYYHDKHNGRYNYSIRDMVRQEDRINELATKIDPEVIRELIRASSTS